jgi:nitrogen regulatory protein PII
MKLIVAIVCPERVKAVLSALNGRDVCLLSFSPVVIAGRGGTEIYRDRQFAGPRNRMRVEVVANDAAVTETLQAMARAGGTGEVGGAAGKVVVMSLEACADLKAGEQEPAVRGE